MANKINCNKTGLALGLLFGILHLGWAILVLLGLAKPLMDWILGLHFLSIEYRLLGFDWIIAILLVLVTFVIGYIAGCVFALIWNWVHKK